MPDTVPPFGQHAPSPVLRQLAGLTARLPADPVSKRVAFALRAVGLALLGPRPVDWESIGVRWRLHPQNNVTEKRLLFTPHYFDAEERAFVAAQIRPDFVFVDAGANAGGYALSIAALAGPAARILAIEPQPEMLRRLTVNCALNRADSVTIVPVALADRAGTVTLAIHRDDLGGTRVADARGGPSVDVPAQPLRDVVMAAGLDHIDVLKADIEGHEETVITAFLETAPPALFPRFLLLEDNRRLWRPAFEQLLAAKGYRITRQNHMNIYYALTTDGG